MREWKVRIDWFLLRNGTSLLGSLLLFSLLITGPAHGQTNQHGVESQPALPESEYLADWSAPASCMSPAELLEALQAELRHVELVEGRKLLGRALESKDGWTVVFEVLDQGQFAGRRVLHFEAGNCRKHDESIVLVAALLLEHGPPAEEDPLPPELATPPKPPEEPEASTAVEEPIVEDEPAPVPRPEPAKQRARYRVQLGAELAFAWTPRLVPGVRLGAGFAPLGALWIDLLGTFVPPTTVERGPGELKTVGGRARLRVCGQGNVGAVWSFQGCGTGGWRGLAGSGRGVETDGTSFFSTAELGVDVGVGASLSDWLALVIEADVVVALQRGTFVFEVVGDPTQQLELHQTGRVLPTVALALRGTF